MLRFRYVAAPRSAADALGFGKAANAQPGTAKKQGSQPFGWGRTPTRSSVGSNSARSPLDNAENAGISPRVPPEPFRTAKPHDRNACEALLRRKRICGRGNVPRKPRSCERGFLYMSSSPGVLAVPPDSRAHHSQQYLLCI